MLFIMLLCVLAGVALHVTVGRAFMRIVGLH